MPPTAQRSQAAPLRVDAEFQSLIAPLTPDEHRQLEANLVAEGCRDALVIWKGVVLDGHHRLEICTRLGIPYTTSEIALPRREAARLWIEENQLGRRNLTLDQRAAIAYRILQRRVAISKTTRARKGGLARRGPKLSLVVGVSTKHPTPRLRELAAAAGGVSQRSIRAISELVKQDATILERIVAGTLTIKDAKQYRREADRASRIRAALKTNPAGVGIYTGDLSLLHQVLQNNSVDLFLTDPIYTSDAVPLYGELAKLAAAKLKPGCFCIAYAGQLHLPEVIAAMSEHLEYYWLCALLHSGPRTRIWARRVSNGWKPIVVFAKRPQQPTRPQHPWFGDFVHGTRDKDHHALGQGASELEYLIERFTLPGQLVCDPFCGGGAVPVACVTTKRRYVATEVDPGVAAAARARIAGYRKPTAGEHRTPRPYGSYQSQQRSYE